MGVNLGTALDSFVPKKHGDAQVERIIQAVIQPAASKTGDDGEENGTEHGKSVLDAVGKVAYRNNLNKIAGRVHNGRSAWKMLACYRNGLVFLDVVMLDVDRKDGHHLRQMYYGDRFEALCTDSADEPVDPNEEFGSVHGGCCASPCAVFF